MSRKVRNFVSIVGLVIILLIMAAPKDQFRIAQDFLRYPNLVEHFTECWGPSGTNAQIKKEGTIAVYLDRVGNSQQNQSQPQYAAGDAIAESGMIINTRLILVPLIAIFLFLGTRKETGT